MNAVSTTIIDKLNNQGFPISELRNHLVDFRNDSTIDCSALKKFCPFIITTGKDSKGHYATTRKSHEGWVDKHQVKIPAVDNSAHYIYGKSEEDAVCNLLIHQTTNRIYSCRDSVFKMPRK